MRRHIPLITIVACQVLLAGLAALLYLVVRPEFIEAFKDLDARIPAHAKLALTTWYLPSLVVITVVCDAIALALRKPRARTTFLGVGLVLPAIGLAAAIDGIFFPLFQLAPAP